MSSLLQCMATRAITNLLLLSAPAQTIHKHRYMWVHSLFEAALNQCIISNGNEVFLCHELSVSMNMSIPKARRHLELSRTQCGTQHLRDSRSGYATHLDRVNQSLLLTA